MTGNPPPIWQGEPPKKSNVARIIYAAIAIALIIAVIKVCTSCTGENRVSSDDYGKILTEQEACAQRFLVNDPTTDTLPPIAVSAPWDSIVPGGVHLISQDSMTKILHGGPGFEVATTSGPDAGTIYVTSSSDHKANVIAHALSHQLARYYPQLRNPPMADSVNYGDHAGRFFASCVAYCPGCPGHPNA